MGKNAKIKIFIVTNIFLVPDLDGFFMNKNKTSEKIFLIIYFIFVAVISSAFHLTYLVSTILFFIPPSVYATIKRPWLFKPIALYALSIGIPFVVIIDTLALFNNAWWETSVFSQRILNLVPLDTVLWAVLYAYTIPVLYEYFFGIRESITLPKKFWKFALGLFIALVTFVITFSLNKQWFTIPYFYAIFVSIFYILTSLIGLIRQPKQFTRLLQQCVFFSILLLIGELGALAADQWGFSGSQYLGMIYIGSLAFPFEEMIWILIGVPAFLYVYLQFTDLFESPLGLIK